MADVHGGLLKCVLQLGACSEKLRSTDELLGKYVRSMQRDLPAASMPRLSSRLAVVAANPDRDTRTREEKFQALLDQGTEAAERLEVAKSRYEKELRRRSEKFQQLVKSRNTDIQEEYARMLKELDDQTEELDQEIAQERAEKASRVKRRREEAEAKKASKKQHLEAETARAKAQLEEYTAQIRQLQEVFASLEKEDAALEAGEGQTSPDDAVTIEERRQQAEERAQSEIAELQQEIALLKEARDDIAEKIDVGSLKAQYAEEKQEIVEETAHLRDVVKELTPQISSSGVRLHSLLRTLAPTPGIGTLMTRLYQQLSSESSAPDSDAESSATPSRKTVELRTFLNSCPSAEEGNRAINELKKLQLIHCYESSGIIALAD